MENSPRCRVAPDWGAAAGAEWLDISPQGWILGDRSGNAWTDPNSPFVMLPLRVEGQYVNSAGAMVRRWVGVDHFSIRATVPNSPDTPDFPNPEPNVKDRIWIMVPQGHSKTVTLEAPLDSTNPLRISAPGVKFNGNDSISLTSAANTFTVSAAPGSESGQDIPLNLTLGTGAGVSSSSKPIGLKVMKNRTVNVTVHPIRSIVPGKLPNGPNLIPTKQQLEHYLNDVYHPQINVKYNFTIKDPIDVAWDTATAADFGAEDDPHGMVTPGDNRLTFSYPGLGPEAETILQASRDMEANINVYLVGAELSGIEVEDGIIPPPVGLTYGFAHPLERVVFIDGDRIVMDTFTGADSNIGIRHTFAHEIGHIVFGEGHPDQFSGPAPLKGTNSIEYPNRLMNSFGRHTDYGKLIVKGEWDKAEIWLKIEEDEGRIQQ